MAIAIPLIALGSLFVISNYNKNDENDEIIEGFETVDGESLYPNDNTDKFHDIASSDNNLSASRFPVDRGVVNKNNVNVYTNPNQMTDKYFKQTGDKVYQRVVTTNPPGSVGSGVMRQSSLTGEPLDKSNFKHNNMVPYFGGNARGIQNIDGRESLLDNKQGSGSQQLRKQEQAPLFKPEENVNWSHGMPSSADFVQSRMNPSTRINNVKPWKEEKVGPGLNLGYTNNGSGGFNSGMQARDQWQPKTVDELRTATNPKMTFDLANHEGPALAPIKNRGVMGKMEKYGPDTTFATGADRYLTTVGDEKRGAARSEHIQKAVSRPDTTTEYYGNSKQTDYSATYTKGEFEESHKQQLGAVPFSQADAQGHYSAEPNNFGRDGYNLLPNNRITTNKPEKKRRSCR